MENILKGFSTFVLLLDLSLKGQMYTFSLNQNVKGGKLANIYTFEGRGKSLEYFGIHSIKCNKSAFNTLEIIYTYTIQGGSTPNIPGPRCTVSVQ